MSDEPALEHHVMADMAKRIAQLERERDELRVAIMGGRPDPSVTHGQFIEMAKSTELARRGALARAEAAEARLAEARRVIKPFSDAAKHGDSGEPDSAGLIGVAILFGPFRAARDWLEKNRT